MDDVPERIKADHDVKDIASLCHFAYSLTMAFGDSWDSDPLRVHLLVTARKLVVSEVEGAPSRIVCRQDISYTPSFYVSFSRTINYPSLRALTCSGTGHKTEGNEKVTVPKEASLHQHLSPPKINMSNVRVNVQHREITTANSRVTASGSFLLYHCLFAPPRGHLLVHIL